MKKYFEGNASPGQNIDWLLILNKKRQFVKILVNVRMREIGRQKTGKF